MKSLIMKVIKINNRQHNLFQIIKSIKKLNRDEEKLKNLFDLYEINKKELI